MAVSLNSVVVFNSSFQGKYQYSPRSGIGTSLPKGNNFTPTSGIVGLKLSAQNKKWGLSLLVANRDSVATDTSEIAERSDSDDRPPAAALQHLDSSTRNGQFPTSAHTEPGPQAPEDVNMSLGSSNPTQAVSSENIKSGPKRSPLTAREKLRAARVLSRYTESKASKPKASKPDLGSKVLEALRESDKGKKKSGLPEAPTNLFDDRKRGMPKQGLTFDFPGGVDALFIAFSFVFISTVMFATTYIVWKVGAIHFNEY